MANQFQAGDLNLSISASANDTLKYLDAVIERLNFIQTGLGGIKGVTKNTSRSNHSGRSMFGFTKLGVSLYTLKKMGGAMANLVQAGSDYAETLNLWQVSMRNNLDMADKFVSKIQKAYGISSTTVMNAQATFKNMIGSLGQISDETAYKLSEALVQMSADFSSLYNVQLGSAVQKMQSMLAGQVRPIRSAGLDMTETTLYQFYQELGGQKSMRQLNRTEKQLLSILAVYKQMGSAGALGDMTKTLNSFANQSRMMAEYWKELKTWSGLLLKDLIEQSGLLVKVNALLILTTEIIKAIAKSKGLGEENFIDGLFESTDNTNEALDELQGKLLDFDKFRSLEDSSGGSVISIDEELLKALTGYSGLIDQAQNSAETLAKTWGKILGFTIDANGEWEISANNLDNVSNAFEAIAGTVALLVGYKLAGWFIGVAGGATLASTAVGLLNFAILGGTVYAILSAIDAFERGDYWIGILATALGVVLVGAFLKVKLTALGASVNLMKFYSTAGLLIVGITTLIAGISSFVSNFDKLSTRAKVWIPIIASLAGVIAAVVAGLTFMSGNWVGAVGIGATIAGIGLLVGTSLSIPNYENGASDIDSGTIFRAGEFGKTEEVFTGSNGKTNVANIQQIAQATYQGTMSALRDWWGGQNAKGDIPQLQEANATGMYEAVTSVAGTRGNKWSKV